MTDSSSNTATKRAQAKAKGLGKAVNMGPLRGNNAFPASNKAMPNNSAFSPGGKDAKSQGGDKK